MNKIPVKYFLALIVVAIIATCASVFMFVYSYKAIIFDHILSFMSGIFIFGFSIPILIWADVKLITAYKYIHLCRCKCGYNYKYPKNVIVTQVGAYVSSNRAGCFIVRRMRFDCFCEICGSKRIFERTFRSRAYGGFLGLNISIPNEIEPEIMHQIRNMFKLDDHFEIKVEDSEIEYNKVYDETKIQ